MEHCEESPFSGAQAVHLGAHAFYLLPEQMIWECTAKRLVLAHPGLGQSDASSWQRARYPETETLDLWLRLAEAVEKYRPKSCLILGRLFDCMEEKTLRQWHRFRAMHAEVEIIWVRDVQEPLEAMDEKDLGLSVYLSEKIEGEIRYGLERSLQTEAKYQLLGIGKIKYGANSEKVAGGFWVSSDEIWLTGMGKKHGKWKKMEEKEGKWYEKREESIVEKPLK